MKRLQLLRHAKSDHTQAVDSDFDRPLAARGRRDAALIAAAMRARGYVPDFILCSPARRTHETLELVRPILGPSIAVHLDKRLYEAEPGTILKIIRELDRRQANVLVIGHNPGLGRLALDMAGSGSPADLARLRVKYPTAALAVLELDVDSWRRATAGALVDYITPASLGAG